MKRAGKSSVPAGFTLIEMLLVVAIIGVMTALIIAGVTNSASDARLIIARQQQAVVQEALNAWVSSQAMGSAGLQAAKLTYSNKTDAQRFSLISAYLSPATAEHFSTNGGLVQSDSMQKVGVSLVFSAWDSGNAYPRVNMQ